MLLILSTTAALVIWIVLWSLGVKGIDGALLGIFIIIVATGVNTALKFLPGRRGDPRH